MRPCRPVLTVFVLCAWLVSGATGEFLRWHVESEHAADHQHHHEHSALGSLANTTAAEGHDHQIVQHQESWIAACSRFQPQIVASVLSAFQVARNTEAHTPAASDPPRLQPPPHLDHFTILRI